MMPLAILSLSLSAGGAELSDRTFNELRSAITPKAEELRFEDVAWRPELWAAALEAQRKDKPILLWAMNGHPMACT